MYKIGGVSLSKQTVGPAEQFIIRVDVIDWNWIKKNLTFANLRNRLWKDLYD